MKKQHIEEAIKHATANKSILKTSQLAGCYYCKAIYEAAEVTEFLADETALCPKCGIDSVLASESPYELTKENLQELHNFWFG